MDEYDARFFDDNVVGSLRSARVVVPIVMNIVKPNRVVDVGCGTGAWLSVFQEEGVKDILGIDGSDPTQHKLLIDPRMYLRHDLTEPLPRLEPEFDLAICLEVAEHLPKEAAPVLVDGLVGLSKVILFSAAIPGQGGTSHMNERWPDYWASLFAGKGYLPFETVRWSIWNRPDVEPWYVQNTLLFVSQGHLNRNKALSESLRRETRSLNVVHPRMFLAAKAEASNAIIPHLIRLTDSLRGRLRKAR